MISKMHEVYFVLSQIIQDHSLFVQIDQGQAVSDGIRCINFLSGAAVFLSLSRCVLSLWVSAWVSYGSWFIESVSRAEMGPLF